MGFSHAKTTNAATNAKPPTEPVPAAAPAAAEAAKDEKKNEARPPLITEVSRRSLLTDDTNSSDDEYETDDEAEDTKAPHSKSDPNLVSLAAIEKNDHSKFFLAYAAICKFENSIKRYIQRDTINALHAEKKALAAKLLHEILEAKNELKENPKILTQPIITAIFNLLLAMKTHQETLREIFPKASAKLFNSKTTKTLDYLFKENIFAYLGAMYSGKLGTELTQLHSQLTIIFPDEAKIAGRAAALTDAETAKSTMIPRLIVELNKKISAVKEKSHEQKLDTLTTNKLAILTELQQTVTPLANKSISFDVSQEHPELVVDYLHALLDAKDKHKKILDPIVKETTHAYLGETLTNNVVWLVPGFLKFLGNYLYSGETSIIIEGALTEVIGLFPEVYAAVLKVRPAEPKSPTDAKELATLGANDKAADTGSAAATAVKPTLSPK